VCEITITARRSVRHLRAEYKAAFTRIAQNHSFRKFLSLFSRVTSDVSYLWHWWRNLQSSGMLPSRLWPPGLSPYKHTRCKKSNWQKKQEAQILARELSPVTVGQIRPRHRAPFILTSATSGVWWLWRWGPPREASRSATRKTHHVDTIQSKKDIVELYLIRKLLFRARCCGFISVPCIFHCIRSFNGKCVVFSSDQEVGESSFRLIKLLKVSFSSLGSPQTIFCA
jgi:hypothetical protein